MHNILRRQKTGVTRRRRKKITASRKTGEVPNTRMNSEAQGQTAWPLCQQREWSAPHPSFSTSTLRPLWLQPTRKVPDLQLKFTENKQPKASGLRWTSLFKEIHMYIYTHTYIPNAQGRRKSIRLWPTPWTWHVREEGWPGAHLCFGTQSGHGPAWRQTTTGGLRCLCVTRLQEEIKPHRHYTGLRAVAQSHDFTSTPGTAARKYVIIEWPVI